VLNLANITQSNTNKPWQQFNKEEKENSSQLKV